MTDLFEALSRSFENHQRLAHRRILAQMSLKQIATAVEKFGTEQTDLKVAAIFDGDEFLTLRSAGLGMFNVKAVVDGFQVLTGNESITVESPVEVVELFGKCSAKVHVDKMYRTGPLISLAVA
jgi:hypothetical protein